MFYVQRLCLVTMVTLCRDRGKTTLPGEGPLPESREAVEAHDERRSRSTQTSRAERSPPFCTIMKVENDP